MDPRLIILAGSVIAIGAIGVGIWGAGWQSGYDAHAAEVAADTRQLNDRLDAATKRAREAEADLGAIRTRLTLSETERENAAQGDPDAGSRGLGAGSLQRLDAIR